MSLQLHIDLARWLRDRLDDGTSREMVMASMLTSGRPAATNRMKMPVQRKKWRKSILTPPV